MGPKNMTIENTAVSVILFFVGFLCGVALIADGWYEEKNYSMGGETADRRHALLGKVIGYAIAGFCFIGLVRTLILLLF